MILDKLFQLMSEKQVSDIFHSPAPRSTSRSRAIPNPGQPAGHAAGHDREDRHELMSPDQIETFESTMEMNLSFGMPQVGNFRSTSSGSGVHRHGGPLHHGQHSGLDTLGLPGAGRTDHGKAGLILIVGATGSGKSTTIASMLDYRNVNRSGHILTVEDPSNSSSGKQESRSSTSAKSAWIRRTGTPR